jgi:GT2 family glycosyltransferase
VADNGSTDDSLALLRAMVAAAPSTPARLHIHELHANLGFARANNLAIAATTAPFVLLLNPDTEVKSGALDILLGLLADQPSLGACAPRLLNPDGSLQPSVWPALPTPLYILVDGLRLYRWLPKGWCARWLLGTHWAHDQRREVEFFYGAVMLVRRSVIQAVGAFDEAFHMYAEDCEWCVRIKRAGWQLYFEPAAEVVHYGGHSAAKRWTAAELVKVKTSANILFQRRLLPMGWFWLNQVTYALVLTIIALVRLLRRQPAHFLLTAAKLHLVGLWR